MVNTKQVFADLRKIVPVITFAKRADTGKYLKMLNIDLDKEEYRCIICGEKISAKNIGIIVSGENGIKIICNKPSCIAKANFLTLYEHI